MAGSAGALEKILGRLRSRGLPPLRPGRVWDAKLTAAIEGLGPEDAGLKDGVPFRCLRSGLHVWNDDLDRAHRIAQEIAHRDGSHWHAILHRREGDYGNARYWYRRVGAAPVYPGLWKAAQELARRHPGDRFASWVIGQKKWDPVAFVGACEKLGENPYLKEVQMREIELLVEERRRT